MKKLGLLAAISLALAGCATTPPNTPGVMVLPGDGKSWDAFRFDDHECRQYASSNVGTPDGAAMNSGVASAAIGTAVGAAAGGLMGGNAGAGVGAGLGLATGALAGSGAANASGRTAQQRYDFGYQQCMYAKGNKIPMSAAQARQQQSYRPAPRAVAPPPPPPGSPPPPPPDIRPN